MRDDSTSAFSHPSLPETRYYDGRAFPLVVSPPAHLTALESSVEAGIKHIQQHRPHLHSLLDKHAVLLFRGFGFKTAEDFSRVTDEGLGLSNFPYSLGNAVRKQIHGERVVTTNESPSEKPIPFHHELAQTPRYPGKLAFFCEKKPSVGGETPICYSPAVYDDLREKMKDWVERIQREGVVYRRRMSRHDRPWSAIGRGWEGTFGAECKEEAEKKLKERGYDWKWEDGEVLVEISPRLRATWEEKGRTSWFNQIWAVWGGWRDELNEGGGVRIGDGGEMGEDEVEAMGQVIESHKVSIGWEEGDVMLVHNMLAMHSRSPFQGERRVYASLAE